MKTNDPTTWHDISNHPTFKGGFDPSWYDGDVDADLRMIRLAAIEVQSQHPKWKCELVVVDDCTMYVNVKMGSETISSIYPSITDDYEPCYYLDVEGDLDEIRVKSVKEVLGVLDRFNS